MKYKEIAVVAVLFLVVLGFPITQAVYEAVSGEGIHAAKIVTDLPAHLSGGMSLKEHMHKWDSQAKEKSLFAKSIRKQAMDFRWEVMRDAGSKAILGVDDWLFYTPGVEYLIHADYKHPRFYKDSRDTIVNGNPVNLKNPLYAILDFQKDLAERGIELLLVPVPGKASIYPEKLSPSVSEAPTSPTFKLMEELRQSGIRVVDIINPLLEARQQSDALLYLKRDTHWTPKGLSIAARVIADELKTYEWYTPYLERQVQRRLDALSASSDTAGDTAQSDSVRLTRQEVLPRYALREVEVMRWGDIAEMTNIPSRRQIWEEEKVVAEKVIDTWQDQPYQDDPDSPILYLGDSFSRIYQTDEPKSAGVIAHIAYNLDFPLASVVNDGGASTIVRQQLYRKADLLKDKKLLVWEFVERDIKFGARGWALEDLPPVPEG